MPHVSRRTFLELASAAMISGCSGGRTSFTAGSAPLVAFSDVHFNPFWTNDAKVFQALDAADFTEWEGIFEACGPAPSIAGADTNYPLLKLAPGQRPAKSGRQQSRPLYGRSARSRNCDVIPAGLGQQ